MRRIFKILLFLPLLYLAVLPFILVKSARSEKFSGVSVDIDDSTDLHFVTKKQLLNTAYGNGSGLSGKKVGDVSASSVEKRLGSLNELKEAEAYTSVDGKVHVYADQRNPYFRIMPSSGGDYFVDEDGYIFKSRTLYSPRLHIALGNITITKSMLEGTSIFDTTIKRTVLRDIFKVVEFIDDDSFWSAQIDHISVDKDSEIDLVPRVGSQLIHLGSAENIEGKFRNLEAFYEQVLPEVGWNKYSVINLEFKDQVVCKRR